MVFLVLVPSPPYVAIQRRELLPRGFTLTLIGRSVFCYGLHKITPICDFHSRILYPVRTFLWCEHQRKMFTPSRLRRQPRGACGLHVVQTGDLSSFRLLRRHGPGRDGWCRPGIPITSVLNQRQIVLPCFCWRHLLHFCSKNVAGGMFFVGTCYTFVVKT